MMRTFVIVLVLILSACGGSHHEVVENPYSERMKELTGTGVDAMQRERWDVADRLFSRALQAAQLANNPELIGQAWYNLGALHVAAGEAERGEVELLRAIDISRRYHLEVTRIRANLALALLRQKKGEDTWKPDAMGSSMPVDVHLSAARLSHLQKRYDVALKEYDYVLSRSDKDRTTLMYKIDAHMGLALLNLELGNEKDMHKEIEEVLGMSRDIGAPRQAAHAFLLGARLAGDESVKLNNLHNALAIYQALEDVRGQRDALTMLLELAVARGESEAAAVWQNKLNLLPDETTKAKTGEPAHDH